jgi:hypothetical protein
MSPITITGLTLLVIGITVWLFGNRMWLLGAGAGALLGLGLLGRFHLPYDSWQGFIIVAGMAVVFGVLGFIGKAFTKIIVMVLGFIAGGAVVISFLNLFSSSVNYWTWIAALIGGLIVAALFNRFVDWGLIIFASLLGSMLVVRGVMEAFLPSLNGPIGSVIIVVLTVLGIFYHARQMK